MTTTSVVARSRCPVAVVFLLALSAGCGGGSPVVPAPTLPSSSTGSSPADVTSKGPSSTAAAPDPLAPPGTGNPVSGAGQAPVPVESNPPGDIPDSVAFVAYRNPVAGYGFAYPEGWARVDSGAAVSFSDKLNGIQADTGGAPADPKVDAVRAGEIPRLQRTQPAFEFRTVEAVTLPAGSGVRVVYRRNSPPDPVTGRQVRDEVESYVIAVAGKSVRLDLFGPVGADNVDAYRTISRSLTLS